MIENLHSSRYYHLRTANQKRSWLGAELSATYVTVHKTELIITVLITKLHQNNCN